MQYGQKGFIKAKKKEKMFSYYLVFVTQMTLDLFISALFTLISIYTWDLERVLNRGEIVNGINSLNYRKKKITGAENILFN